MGDNFSPLKALTELRQAILPLYKAMDDPLSVVLWLLHDRCGKLGEMVRISDRPPWEVRLRGYCTISYVGQAELILLGCVIWIMTIIRAIHQQLN